jgi:hypothetical protein
LKEKIDRVPLIQELVNQFQEIFFHLAITQVWLLCKCKSGNGFRGGIRTRCQVSATLLWITLEGATMTTTMRSTMGPRAWQTRKLLCAKKQWEKNQKQQTSAIKAIKVFGRATLENGVGICALMSLKVD